MSKRGSYLGGHTLLGRGSDWFSKTKGQPGKKLRSNAVLKGEAKARLLEAPIVAAPIPGERTRDLDRLKEIRQHQKEVNKRRQAKSNNNKKTRRKLKARVKTNLDS